MQRYVLARGVAAIIVIVLLVVGYLLLSRPPAQLRVLSSPTTVTVTINDKDVSEVASKDTIRIQPGEQKITVSRDHFQSYTTRLNVTSDQVNQLYVTLIPSDLEGKSIINDSKESINRESVYSENFDFSTSKIAELHPLITSLPYYGRSFIISQGKSVKQKEGPYSTAIYIKATNADARKQALDKIRDLGYDPSDYEIIFETLIRKGRGEV